MSLKNKLSIELIMDVVQDIATPNWLRIFNLLRDVIQLSKDQATERHNLTTEHQKNIEKLEKNLTEIGVNSDSINEAVAKLSDRVDNINNI